MPTLDKKVHFSFKLTHRNGKATMCAQSRLWHLPGSLHHLTHNLRLRLHVYYVYSYTKSHVVRGLNQYDTSEATFIW